MTKVTNVTARPLQKVLKILLLLNILATLKSIDYNVAMTFILNNNNNSQIIVVVEAELYCGVQSCTAIHRVPRRRMGERPLDIEVSCEISGFRPDE